MPKYNIGRTPLALPLIAFVGGLMLSHADCPFWLIIVLVLAALGVYIGISRMAGILLLTVSVGMVDGMITWHNRWPDELPKYSVTCAAVVNEIREESGVRTIQLVIDSVADSQGAMYSVSAVRVLAMIPSFLPEIIEGDRIKFRSQLSPMTSDIDIPDEKDVTSYLRSRGVVANTFIHPDSVYVVGRDDSLYWTFQQIKRDVSKVILRSPLSDTAGAFIIAVLLGDGSMLSSGVKDTLTGIGLAHVFALSGLHVGIVVLLIGWLLWPLFLLRRRKVRYLLMIVLLWCYAIITGLSPSVTRAVIMTTIFMLTMIFERRSVPLNSLCLAAFVILIFDPDALFSLSFQMSFLAVTAILIAGWLLSPLRDRLHPVVFGFVSFVGVSLAAVIATGIVSAYYFHVLPVYFILANAGIALFLPIIICGGILLIICEYLGCDVTLLCMVLDACVDAVCYIAGCISRIPGATIDRIYFEAWLILPYFVIVACVVIGIRIKRLVWPIIALLLCVAVISIHFLLRPVYPPSELFVTRERSHTNVIMRCGCEAALFTTAKKHSRQDIMDDCFKKYSTYLERRGATGFRDITDSVIDVGNVIDFNGRRMRIVNADMDTVSFLDVNYDYLLVCRGFKGDVVDLALTHHADTVLLSADINPIRSARYGRELQSVGIAYRSLRAGALHLTAGN